MATLTGGCSPRSTPRGAALRHAGFTLTELMIVVAIAAILAAIAVPSYISYTREANRSDAQNSLLALASEQEKQFPNASTYTSNMTQLGCTAAGVTPEGAYCHGVGAEFRTPKELYTISVTAASAAAFTIQAVARTGTSQEKDASPVDCRTMASDNTGRGSPPHCWGY